MTKTVNALAALAITGKGKQARTSAFSAIASQAYTAETGKAAFLDTLAKALGNAPTDEQKAYARLQTTIGVAAVRMPANELPRDCKDMAARIAYVSDLALNYQAPTTAVAGKVRKLNKGKTGWRSAVQHRIIRNAEDRASKYLAELGAGAAKTEAAKNAAKPAGRKGGGNPAPHHGKGKAAPAAPTHGQLVTTPKPLDGVAYAAQMLNFTSTALQYDNKNAKVRPIEYGPVAEALVALHKLALKCDAEMHVRLAAQEAQRA